MRWATFVLVALVATGCNDLRDFRGRWEGPRVGDAEEVRVGVGQDAHAQLTVDDIDQHGLSGTLTVDGLATNAPIVSLAGAEADALSDMTFAGSPLRVYMAFAGISDGKGDALAMIALFDHDRIEVRVMRGGTAPLYGIFALTEAPEETP
ncbi:MAG TPA: hypothetical protein VGM39_16210 [Kofleriaceae bacterium]